MALYVGLMSGTSMDGIDAALVEMTSHSLIHGITIDYSDEVKSRLDKVLEGNELSLAALCQLNTLIGKEFAAATQKLLSQAHVLPHHIAAIGSHGQTVCHDTQADIPYTLQLGCGHTISSHTGITVVADFRTRDLVHGGQGAPFAPLYHQELLSSLNTPLAVVNIGGIANVTLNHPTQKTVGWDVGPGNCLMDAWIKKQHGLSFDAQGMWARQGQVIPLLLEQLLLDPFLSMEPPKSIGKEYFSLAWLERHIKTEYSLVDVQATLIALTALTISNALKNQKQIKQVYLCGGGAHNVYLQEQIACLMPHASVQSIATEGFDPDYLEAMMFAWLAHQTIKHIPLDLSSITGSKGSLVLGAVYPANKML